jgi:hypothetical protein
MLTAILIAALVIGSTHRYTKMMHAHRRLNRS